ncbi:MAG: HD domain-containing phosphohydrolase [Pseudomonadota bacterium]
MVRLNEILQPEGEKQNKDEEAKSKSIEKKAAPNKKVEDKREENESEAIDNFKFSDVIATQDFLKDTRKLPPQFEKEKESKTIFSSNGIKYDLESKVVEKTKAKRDVDRLFKQGKFAIMDVMDIVKANSRVDESTILALIKNAEKVVDCMLHDTDHDLLYIKAVYNRHTIDDFISHGINVGIFSLKIGIGLNYSKQKLISLFTAAALHDIGMLLLEANIIHSKSTLTEKEMDLVKTHPEKGYNLFKDIKNKEVKWMAEIILQEHERINGKGYPKQLKKESIHDFARIIGLVDDYEALTHDRPHRRRFLPYDAIKIIIEQKKGYFDKDLLKILLKKISVFPLNSLVELNTKEIGRVIATDETKPLRPRLQILFDSNGNEVKIDRFVNLADNSLLFIVNSIYEEDIFTKENETQTENK